MLESAEDKAGKKFIACAFLFILVVLGASSLLRDETLRLAVTQQSALQVLPETAPLGSNPFAAPASLPPEVAPSPQNAQDQVQGEEASEQLLGGVAGIVGLGVISSSPRSMP